MPQPQYTVSVRSLCEFTARRGDLDLRFTPSPSSLEGIAGHQTIGARRPAGYETEVALSGDFEELHVRGRADGWNPERRLLEEFKTYRGRLENVRDNHRALHRAQLRMYGALQCRRLGLERIELALVYFDVDRQTETALSETATAAELEDFFGEHCRRFLEWARAELAHRRARDAALESLQFPHPGFRTGQRELAAAVWRAARDGKPLVAEAPTGIGKTIATLFAQLKAVPAASVDKLFFLTAKTTGRELALDALAIIGAAAPALRVVEIVARDKACEHPGKACHGDACPLARGFYDRLDSARAAAIGQARNDRDALRTLALAHDVCPYWLGQELARWSDVVVGDYNHWFDTSALLHALTVEQQWRVGVLVDEAHNLLDRARGMYTAELDPAVLRAARAEAPTALRRPLERLQRAWRAVAGDQTARYETRDAPPARLLDALAAVVAEIGTHLAEQPARPEGALQRLLFDALHFARIAAEFAEHSLFDVTLRPRRERPGDDALLCVRNVIPAPFLKPRLAAAHTTTLFSATLSPHDFHVDTLGLPADTRRLDAPSPFDAEQLEVRIVRDISTRYAQREASVAPIAALIDRQYGTAPGNYLAFFSSYGYLEQVLDAFRRLTPEVPVWVQARGMSEAERDAFLARFEPGGRGIGFAVLGGSFAEGIDLPGDRLVGAFVATLGLPQLNPVTERMRERIETRFGRGYAYTYLYPGLRKVVQAAGRVIRRTDDRGVVFLIDTRFARSEVRQLLPSWWRPSIENAACGQSSSSHSRLTIQPDSASLSCDDELSAR